ncbi:MFS transporter [Lentzea sp. NBRC 105346]|uniref:MFS transporter n=1 Tax=Lentzea sp. NBRC 105346 TaxID=3032205 RepID=UPI00255455D6|nr:MFS transporter [Lentzea sp. NBRC 105346]
MPKKLLVPFLCLLYFVNYLDRVNIGFAGPNGMSKELGLTATVFGFASGVFFIGYLILEVPSNLALHRFGARRWIARIMVSWGIVATAMAFVPNGAVLIGLRFLLGVAEAGFFPGIILYLTWFYGEEQRARIVAWFMVAVPVSTALGATLSGLLIQATDWRTMFLLEGIPAIVLAVITWFYLPDPPQQNHEEQPLKNALANPRVYALSFVYFGIVYGLYTLGFFLPTIIAGLAPKASIVERGLINAIPYVLGAVAMVLWARHGDRTGERKWHVAVPMLLGGVAIPIALYLNSPVQAMIAVSICAIGVCAALPTFWALPSSFLKGTAAAGGIALINSLGNISGFAAPYVTGWLRDATGTQRTGLWVVGVCMVAAAITVLVQASGAKKVYSAE